LAGLCFEMRTVWIGIYDRGAIPSERVHFRASADIDLVRYVLLDTVFLSANAIGNGNKSCFWFPSQIVRAGENVVVYTRAGTTSREVRPDGSVYHFIFRGKTSALYARPEACAVLYELADWATIR
jgi:hypothetical protein